jgi:hypothetical protein
MFVTTDPLFLRQREQIVELAARHAIPAGGFSAGMKPLDLGPCEKRSQVRCDALRGLLFVVSARGESREREPARFDY